jgi:RimJ/RimL family protein N-acetyltransferase
LAISREHSRAELGYWIGVPYWRRGFATEAGRSIVRFGFEELGLHRVQARHLERNPASGSVLRKLGMQLEGIHRHAVRKWGVFEDVALYSVLITDWRQETTAARPGARGS